MKKAYKFIGFDADDTLWVNEPNYREAENIFCELLTNYLPAEKLNATLFETEMQNLEVYGYGAKAFVLSLIETALKITNNQLPASITEKIIMLGKDLINKPVILLEGITELLEELKLNGSRMIIATKGDLLDQERKLKKSGLEKHFHHVEVMSDKKENDYKKLISRLDIQAHEFLMIGNSVKSDILPVLNIGGNAIHVPYHTTWAYENDIQIEEKHKFPVAEKISDVLSLV